MSIRDRYTTDPHGEPRWGAIVRDAINLKIATAQAEALRVQNSALAQSKEVLELRRIEVEQTKADRWNGQLPQNVYAGAPIPFLNVSK
jgi:prohibitin 2